MLLQNVTSYEKRTGFFVHSVEPGAQGNARAAHVCKPVQQRA